MDNKNIDVNNREFYCHNPNLTSTQPKPEVNLNCSWVWYDYDFTLPPPPHYTQPTQVDDMEVLTDSIFHNELRLSQTTILDYFRQLS